VQSKQPKPSAREAGGTGLLNTTTDVKIYGGYESHYNLRLNKCFYLETVNNYEGKAPFKNLVLYDLHENREIASYGWLGWDVSRQVPPATLFCVVQGKGCNGEEEWRACDCAWRMALPVNSLKIATAASAAGGGMDSGWLQA
jgi:hypothetical protein